MGQISTADYELAVLEKMRLDFAGCAVLVRGTEGRHEHTVRGRHSLILRQVDVAAYRPGEKLPFLIADAKRHETRPLEITHVESFIGMMDDVGASIGLLVAPVEGVSDGAVRRAAAASADVLILTTEQALTYKWLPEARRIFPQDWTFHEQLALAVRHLNDGLWPDEIMKVLEMVHFEEWTEFVRAQIPRNDEVAT